MSKAKSIAWMTALLIATFAANAGSTDPARITMIQLYGTPNQNFTDVYVTTCPSTGTSVSPCIANSGCSNKGGFVLERAHPLFREIYATLLAARLSGVPVGLLGNGACTSHGLEPIAEAWIPNS